MAKIIEMQEVDSTMDEVGRLLELEKVQHGDGVLALRQTQGRGRLHRAWYTGQSGNLAVSFWIEMTESMLPPFPLVVALAAIDCLSALGLHDRLRCKWPNDILVDGRKICGILCQFAQNHSHNKIGCIAGLGINLGLGSEQIHTISQPATSLKELTGKDVRPLTGAKVLQEALIKRTERLGREGFAPQAEEWCAHCDHIGHELRVETGFETIEGKMVGVSPQGALLLEREGKIREIICGDVTKVRLV